MRLLLACALVGCGLIIQPHPVANAEETVTIEITSVTPDVFTTGASVVLRGTVTNNTSQALSDVRVVVQTNPTRIETPATLAAIVATNPAITRNRSLVIDALSAAQGVLRSGQSATFTLTLNPATDGLTPGAVYAAETHLQQRTGTSWTSLATSRILLPYLAGQGDESQRPTAVTTVLLSSRPSLITPGVSGNRPAQALFADEHLGTELDTRLGDLLAYAETPGVSVVIDPLLYDEVAELAAGYNVRDAGGGLTPGAHQGSATEWLAKLNALLNTAGERCYRGLSGTPELAAVADTAYSGMVAAAATTLRPGHPLAELPLAVISITGRFDAVAAAYLTEAPPAVVIADTVATTVRAEFGTITALFAATNLTARDGTSPDGGTALERRTRLFSERYLAWLNGSPLVTVITDQSHIALETNMEELLDRAPLSSLEPPTAMISWTSTDATPLQVPAALVSLTESAAADFAHWSRIGDTPEAIQSSGNATISAAWSANWDGDWTAAISWLETRLAPIHTALTSGSVTLKITPEWYIGEDTAAMPVQLSNTMGVTVRVRVRFSTENEQRLHIPASEFVVIAPGETETVRVEPEAYGSGTLAVTAYLQDAYGNVINAPVQFTVSSSSAGALAWLIIIGAGLAFLVATGLRVRHVRKYGKRAATDRRSLAERLRSRFERAAAPETPDTQADLS
ncbi:MAG: DUF6049 family protein [Propionibacteriaceae bacterium]|nr:DUF6049 family protein [Propionibacteriaceae bacterium]